MDNAFSTLRQLKVHLRVQLWRQHTDFCLTPATNNGSLSTLKIGNSSSVSEMSTSAVRYGQHLALNMHFNKSGGVKLVLWERVICDSFVVISCKLILQRVACIHINIFKSSYKYIYKIYISTNADSLLSWLHYKSKGTSNTVVISLPLWTVNVTFTITKWKQKTRTEINM
jgi:hypothetical protein